MNRAFADTFYFLALLNPRDRAHARAVAHATNFPGELLTTAWVLTELGDAMCSPDNRAEFIALLRDLQANPHFRIVPPRRVSVCQGGGTVCGPPGQGMVLDRLRLLCSHGERGDYSGADRRPPL